MFDGVQVDSVISDLESDIAEQILFATRISILRSSGRGCSNGRYCFQGIDEVRNLILDSLDVEDRIYGTFRFCLLCFLCLTCVREV